MSRSTFAGQGKFISHWFGGNYSKFDNIKYSISGIMSMNVFGINLVGADICGNLNQTTEDLCLRWMKVGAFYPLARGHDDLTDFIGKESSKNTSSAMRYVLRWRYALLRYFYTQMYLSSENGGTFWRPLFFEFPEEAHAYNDIERNIMIGPSIKFSPMIDNSSDKSQFFIMPAGRWCNIINYEFVTNSGLSNVSLPTSGSSLNLHLRPGHIIPLQRDAELLKVNTTKDLENMPMGLIINPDQSIKAHGEFYADDGISENPNQITHITFDFNLNEDIAYLTFTHHKADFTSAEYIKLKTIEIVGADLNNLENLDKMKINEDNLITGNIQRLL